MYTEHAKPQDPDDPSSPLHPSRDLGRPKPWEVSPLEATTLPSLSSVEEKESNVVRASAPVDQGRTLILAARTMGVLCLASAPLLALEGFSMLTRASPSTTFAGVVLMACAAGGAVIALKLFRGPPQF